MEIFEVIESAQSGKAFANLGSYAGIDEGDARAVVEAVLPQLSVALERNTLSRGGLADVVRALGDGHHEQVLEDAEVWRDPRVIKDGTDILAHILGSEYRSQALAARAARATGISGGIIEALLPIIAQLLMGAISRYMRGGLGDILSRLPQSGRREEKPVAGEDPWGSNSPRETGGTRPDRRSSSGFDLPNVELPKGGGYPMPPMPPSPDGPVSRRQPQPRETEGGGFGFPLPADEGSAPQDEAGRRSPSGPTRGGYPLPRYEVPGGGQGGGGGGGSAGPSGGFPLPGPAAPEDNPYGDLSDILRKRGGNTSPAGEGSLWSVVRNILGGALGFGGSGFFGWIVRLLVLRLGWPILKRVVFGR